MIGVATVMAEALWGNGIAIGKQTPLSLLYYALTAITGTMVVYEVCRYLDTKLHGFTRSLMRFTGEHTLSIMALHFSAFKMVSYGYILECGLSIERLLDFPVIREFANSGLGFLLYTFVGLCVPLVLAWLWLIIKAKAQLIRG